MRRRILFLFLGLTLAGASLAWGQPGREFGGGGGFRTGSWKSSGTSWARRWE